VTLTLHIVLVLHLVGFAALLGGGMVQLGDAVKVVNTAMLWGVLTVVVTGIALVGVLENLNEPVDRPKIAVKFAIALVIALLCWANRARTRVPRGLFDAVLVLVLADLVLSVVWQ
jgi:hypothetical protein